MKYKVYKETQRNLANSCFILPLFHEHLFSPELPRAARLLKTCVEKIIVCAIEIMLVTLPLVQMNQAPREVNQQIKDVRTNQAQIMIKS